MLKKETFSIRHGISFPITSAISHTITCIDVDGNMLYVGTRTRGVLRFSLDN